MGGDTPPIVLCLTGSMGLFLATPLLWDSLSVILVINFMI
jgi:hypothetical protein